MTLLSSGKPRQDSPLAQRSVSSEDLPIPDPLVLSEPPSTKKSHARRQPPGHVPRPRNAFILFRSALVRQGKLPTHIQGDHCKISRHAGDLWHSLDDSQRSPWLSLAEKEKEKHASIYPGYRYNPTSEGISPRSPTRRKKNRNQGDPSSEEPKPKIEPGSPPQRRPSSCPPPGASPAHLLPLEFSTDGTTLHTIVRDDQDCGRRPSAVTMYHSLASTYEMRANLPNDVIAFPWLSLKGEPNSMPSSWPFEDSVPAYGDEIVSVL